MSDREPDTTDVWGAIFLAQWSGGDARHRIERDDGRVELFESAATYFRAPRVEGEGELLDRLEGPVLDLAAGAGAYALYLQEKGFDVTAADRSEGAVRVCRGRGCRTVVRMDLRSVEIAPEAFGSIVVMGNTIGAYQTPETFPGFLRALRRGVRPGGRLLFTMIDPLDTTDEGHLAYQQRNRQQGIPPGLIRMRVGYDGASEDWMPLWMLTEDEIRAVAADTGWWPVDERRDGPARVRLFERAPDPS